MRIGMILDNIFPPDERVKKEALTLIKDGHEVFLYCLNYHKQKNTETIEGIKVRRYPGNRVLYKLSALAYTFPFYHFLLIPGMRNFIRTNAIEVVHMHDMVGAVPAINLAHEFKIPFVLDLHEDRPEIMRSYKHVTSWSGRMMININYWKKMYYGLSKRATKIVVVTEYARKDIVEVTGRPIDDVIVVPNTTDLEVFTRYPIHSEIQNRMKRTFNLLYVGDTSIRRGIDTVLYAIAELKEQIPQIRFWVVGQSSADQKLRRLCQRLNIEQYVYFESWQDVSLFPSYISGAHICLSPLKRNKHHDTTFANKVFQYMAMNKPVLVSDCIAQKVLVTNEICGWVFESENVDDLQKKIETIFNSPEEAHQRGKNGGRAVQHYWNWTVTSKSLCKLYQSL